MSVRLKFYVVSKTETAQSAGSTEKYGGVRLTPVTSGSDENKQFYKYTPSGQIEFQTINQAALDALPLGAEVYIDLTVVQPSTQA